MWTALGILKLIKRGSNLPFEPAVAMVGVKPGDKVIVLGAGTPALAAAVAAVTGLNGQTTVVDSSPAAKAGIDRAAAGAGALVEFTTAPLTNIPIDPDLFAVSILPSGLAALGTDSPMILAEAIRLVRPGGRITVCEPVARPGLFKLAQTRPLTDPVHVVQRLTAAGLRAARHVGTLEGIAFIEAAKPRQ
jgi:ubiquinone/menaquinone biosynthesis C-methylase UbiE